MPEFMLLIKQGDYTDYSPEQMQQIVQKYIAWAGKLRERGLMKGGDELQSTGRVVSLENGKIVDGPYAETKESVGGYFLIEVKDYEEAVAITRECPGLQHGASIEIRQISDYQ
jgi:hypothetical protein